MANIDQSQAATIAASLTHSATTLYVERIRSRNIVQDDPNYHVKALYAEMLDFVREHHGLPRGTDSGDPANWRG
jgi:hypothetical protein